VIFNVDGKRLKIISISFYKMLKTPQDIDRSILQLEILIYKNIETWSKLRRENKPDLYSLNRLELKIDDGLQRHKDLLELKDSIPEPQDISLQEKLDRLRDQKEFSDAFWNYDNIIYTVVLQYYKAKIAIPEEMDGMFMNMVLA